MSTYSEVGGQHDFSIVGPPDPSGACRGKGSGYARLGLSGTEEGGNYSLVSQK